MKVLVDTNFVLSCVKRKIDFGRLADEIFDEEVEWIVPRQVLNELGNLKDRVGMKVVDKRAAEMSFSILEDLDPEIVELGRCPNVDIAIVNYVVGKDIILATLDRDLKGRVDNKILTIRGKGLCVV